MTYFISGGFGGADKSENLGPAYPVQCPHCRTPVELHLVRSETWFTIYGLPVDAGPTLWYLVCPACRMAIPLRGKDAEHAQKLREAFAAFRAGKTDSVDFGCAVMEHPIEALMRVVAANTNWICAHCGEEVPETFDVCWKCQHHRDGGGAPPPEDGGALPGTGGPTHPVFGTPI